MYNFIISYKFNFICIENKTRNEEKKNNLKPRSTLDGLTHLHSPPLIYSYPSTCMCRFEPNKTRTLLFLGENQVPYQGPNVWAAKLAIDCY